MAELLSAKTVDDTKLSYVNQAFTLDASDGNNKETTSSTPAAATSSEPDFPPSEGRRILKNVVVISVAFMLNFTAFQSMANLQSSINPDEGLGTYSLSVLYGALVLSSMFVPTVLIRRLTCKWTLVVTILTYSLYIGAQFKPSFATLIPGAVVLGLGAAPLWAAKCTYLTHVGYTYARIRKQDSQEVIVRFFGIFFLAFQTAQIWGNLIAGTVLSSGAPDNSTLLSEDEIQVCGANFCGIDDVSAAAADNKTSNANLAPPSNQKIYTLASIYLACSLSAAVLVALFVDPLLRYGERERTGSGATLTGWKLMVATFRQMKKPYQILIIPLTIWSGMEQGFLSAEFTQAFVTCAWGVQHVGYVLICYGVLDSVFSASFGPVLHRVGRTPIFVFGAAINVAMIVVFLTWKPSNAHPEVIFVMAGAWGVADAIWQTQINAFYGVLFPSEEEAAFSNYRLWESVGFIIAYVYSKLLCVYLKLYVLLGVILLGMTGYIAIEMQERIRLSRGSTNGESANNNSREGQGVAGKDK